MTGKLNKKDFASTAVAVFTCSCLVGIYFLIIFTTVWKSDANPPINAVNGDGLGYYQYLPAIFINGDFGDEKVDYRYIIDTKHGALSRYSAGTAALIAPFFLAAYFTIDTANFELTGFENHFQRAVSIAALFYFMLGLLFLSALLRRFVSSSRAIIVVLVAVALGTNLLYYTVITPAFSHVYSFSMITGFLLAVAKFSESKKTVYFLLASVAFGIILWIRMFNGLIILALPLFFGSFSAFRQFLNLILSQKLRLFLGVFLACGISGMQQLLWFIQTKEWVLWGYGNDGFYFNNPAISEVLFGFRKGLFVYTPLLLLAVIGLMFLIRKSVYQTMAYVLFFIILTYFMSAWWMWYYGFSFGQRPFIDFYGVLVIPLTLFFEKQRSQYMKWLGIAGVLACIVLNLVQSYQYVMQILSPFDMNQRKYFHVFMETSGDFENILGGYDEIIPFHESEEMVFLAKANFEGETSEISNERVTFESLSRSNVSDYRDVEFNMSLEFPIDTSLINGRPLFLKILMDAWVEESHISDSDPLFVMELRGANGATYHYLTFKLHDLPEDMDGDWHSLDFSMEIPVRHSLDVMKLYVWNRKRIPLYLDNVQIKIYKLE